MQKTLLSLSSKKEKEVSKTNYAEAARVMEKELKLIHEIIECLNSKGIFDGNLLQIKFVESPFA